MFNLFDPKNYHYILTGDWIVLGVIVTLVILFFRYRIPQVERQLNKKLNVTDFEKERNSCQRLLCTKLEALDEKIGILSDVIKDRNDRMEKRMDHYFNER